MITIEKEKGETRETYLIRLAIAYIRSESGYSHNENLFYDDAECDGYCLADDLEIEFGLD